MSNTMRETFDGTWVISNGSMYYRRITPSSKVELTQDPFYFGNVVSAATALQEYKEDRFKERQKANK